MAKDFYKLSKLTKTLKFHASASLFTHCSDSLSCCDHPSYPTIHIDNCCCSTKCSHSPSHLQQWSAQSSIILYLCWQHGTVHKNSHHLSKPYLDITGHDLVSPPQGISEVLSHSDRPEHSSWHLIQMKTLTIPFILTVMVIVKTPLLLLIQQLIKIMNPMKHIMLMENDGQIFPWSLMFAITMILKPSNTDIGIMPTWMNSPQLG